MRLTSLVEGEPQEGFAFRERYRAPSVEEIDPNFIHMHPAVMERSDFEALEEYVEPVEPRVLESFDYRSQADATTEILSLKGDSYRLRDKDLGARPSALTAEIA